MQNSDPKTLQKTIEETLGPKAVDYEVRFRAMFGGILGYAYGRPFALLSNAGIALKLSKNDTFILIESEGGYPLRFKPEDPPSKSYTIVPQTIVTNQKNEFEHWLIKSADYVKTLPLKKKKPRKPRSV